MNRRQSTGTTRSIDVHAHAAIPAAGRLAQSHPAAEAAARREAEILGPDARRVNDERLPALGPKLTDAAVRLADMDAADVDVQVVSPLPTHFHDRADAALSAEIGTAVNEGIADHCSAAPERSLSFSFASRRRGSGRNAR